MFVWYAVAVVWYALVVLATGFVTHLAILPRLPSGAAESGGGWLSNRGTMSLAGLLLLQAGIAVGIALAWNVMIGLSVIATEGFAWVTFVNYDQKFRPPDQRSRVARRFPRLISLLLLGLLVSSAASITTIAPWWTFAVPMGLWIVAGIVAAETAIRRVMRASSHGEGRLARAEAIRRINAVGSGEMAARRTYPFP